MSIDVYMIKCEGWDKCEEEEEELNVLTDKNWKTIRNFSLLDFFPIPVRTRAI